MSRRIEALRERNHPVDASRTGQDESIDRYKRGFRDGRAAVLNRPPPPPPTGGGGRHRGGGPRPGCPISLILLPLLLAVALFLIWRT